MLPKKRIAYIDCRQKLTVLDFRTALKSLFAFQQRIFMLSHMFEQLTDWSVVSGVYPVMRKWRRGVGMSDAMRPIRSLFIYPG